MNLIVTNQYFIYKILWFFFLQERGGYKKNAKPKKKSLAKKK